IRRAGHKDRLLLQRRRVVRQHPTVVAVLVAIRGESDVDRVNGEGERGALEFAMTGEDNPPVDDGVALLVAADVAIAGRASLKHHRAAKQLLAGRKFKRVKVMRVRGRVVTRRDLASGDYIQGVMLPRDD